MNRRQFLRGLGWLVVIGLCPSSRAVAPRPEICRLRRVAVNSEAIRSIGYHHKTRTLEVQFRSGDTYRYSKVPKPIYDAFVAAESKGRFFQEQVRGRYDYWKVDPK